MCIRDRLYPILDSVIMKTEEVLACQKFENEITFSFEIDFNGSMNSIDLVISVEDSLDSFNHALWTDAVFYYKEYKFCLLYTSLRNPRKAARIYRSIYR